MKFAAMTLVALIITEANAKAAAACACPRDLYFTPVCCDDTTFGNQCLATCAGHDTCDSGACTTTDPTPKPTPGPTACACNRMYAPVCCNGKTFNNQCLADCAQHSADTCTSGTCPCTCTREYFPVCCNGETFANQCLANCEGHCDDTCDDSGACPTAEPTNEPTSDPTGCACNRMYAPVCCDGKTFNNQCLADCEGHDTCDSGACVCTKENKPVCCNGKTFNNPCLAKSAGHTADTCADEKCPGRSDFCMKHDHCATFKNDCNTCLCMERPGEDAGEACTRMGCIETQENIRKECTGCDSGYSLHKESGMCIDKQGGKSAAKLMSRLFH